MSTVLAWIALLAALASSSSPAAWQHWHYSRLIVTRAALNAGLVRFALPAETYGKASADIADVRVIDEAGDEIPFAIDQQLGDTSVSLRTEPLSEEGFVPGRYTQAVADVGTDGSLNNSLTIDTTADEFSDWVEVAASDDEKTWRIVRDRAPIYRFSSDGLEGSLTVRFAATRSRWLRIRVQDGAKEFPIRGCSVANVATRYPELVEVSSELMAVAGAPAQQTWFVANVGAANIPVSTVRLTTSEARFHRSIQISASDDDETWTVVGQGEIYRDPRAGTSLSVEFPESRGRYWRVAVFNRNDRPLTYARAALLATPRYVSFRAEEPKRYRLIYGNADATAPQYDFATITAIADRERAPLVALGPETATVPAAESVPWTEAHPIVLWLALGLAVVVLASLAIRAMR